MIKKGPAHNQKKLNHSFFKIRADKFQNYQSFLRGSVFQSVRNEALFLFDPYLVFSGQPANGLEN